MAVLRQAGFRRILPSASYDCWTSSPDSTARAAAAMGALLASSPFGQRAVELGLVDQADIEASATAIARWATHPGAFAAEAWCEAVAGKE